MPKLSDADRDAFLGERGVLCRIATVTREGAPHVTPVWFIYEEGKVFVTPRYRSAWREHLVAEPRVAMTIDETATPYRKVVIEGTAVLEHGPGEDDAWRERYRRIARRYTPDDWADRYIETTINEPRSLYSVALADARVRTWRMPVQGEDPRGIWAEQYYVDTPRS